MNNKQGPEWVERGMELADKYADAAPTGYASGDRLMLRAHLESREEELRISRQSEREAWRYKDELEGDLAASRALVKQLAEALERTAQTLAWQCFGECRSHSAATLLTPSQADELARAALAAYQEKT